jgi:predicted nucleotidyltransferase
MPDSFQDLPASVKAVLGRFLDASRTACGPDLVSLILFGSAAEGRLRPTSDVNVLLVLRAWDTSRIDGLRAELRVAHAAVRLNAMFLLEREIPEAMEAFAVKFADILHRRRVLFGTDPFAGARVPRDAALRLIRQALLNLELRQRERYAMLSLREEQLTGVLADAAGPLRACAATLLDLEGAPAASPKEALAALAAGIPGAPFDQALQDMSAAREGADLPPGRAASALAGLSALAQALRARAQALR